jgi:hypothetical protein
VVEREGHYLLQDISLFQPTRIRRIRRTIPHVPPCIGIPSSEPDRIFADELTDCRIVVPGPVVVEVGFVVGIPAGEAEEVVDGGVGFTSDLAECVVGANPGPPWITEAVCL